MKVLKKYEDFSYGVTNHNGFLNETLFDKSTEKVFNKGTELGTIKYHFTSKDSDDYYEYGEKDNDNWNKAKKWVVIDIMRVKNQYVGDGKKLLNIFINFFPIGTGILANPIPLDGDISFDMLQEWYMKQGFTYFDESGNTLMKIKNLN